MGRPQDAEMPVIQCCELRLAETLNFSPLPLVLGITLASDLHCLAGFIAVVRAAWIYLLVDLVTLSLLVVWLARRFERAATP